MKFKIKNKWSGKIVIHDENFLQMLVDNMGNKVAAKLLSMKSAPGKEFEPFVIKSESQNYSFFVNQDIYKGAEYMGEISKLISNKRGQLLEMNQTEAIVTVRAKIPVAEMIGWSSDLRSATGGRGSSSLIDQAFEKLPDELQIKIVKQIIDRKGLSESQVGV